MSTTKVVGRPTLGFDRDEYVRLLGEWPPVKIRDEAQARATEEKVERLLCLADLSAAGRAYVDLLTDWDDAHDDIPDVSGVELIREPLEERGLRQRDLVGIFATESVASEVLAGRRGLTRRRIEGLSRFFNVSPAEFAPSIRSAAPDRRSEFTAEA